MNLINYFVQAITTEIYEDIFIVKDILFYHKDKVSEKY